MRFDEISDTDPALQTLLLKLHKHATAGFNAKSTQAVLNLFDGWKMTPEVFIKPSDELGHNDGFRAMIKVNLERYSPWSKKMETHSPSLLASSDRSNTTLRVSSYDAEEAKALHDKVAEFVVPSLPEPKKAKTDQYFVMHLTDPVAETGKDGDVRYHWSFDLYRKCKGFRITAPNGLHFDVCGPTQVLGYGGTKDFSAFFTWALADTDLEDAVNARLGLPKHVKASERPRIPVGGQTIGTCAICMREQVVRNGKMVLHGYQRPGYGWVVGNCFGTGRDPYEVSAEACAAYIPVLQGIKERSQRYLSALKAGEVTKFTEPKRNYRTGRDESIVIEKGDKRFPEKLRLAIRDTESQIGQIDGDIAEMNKRIQAWKPGEMRRVEGLPVT